MRQEKTYLVQELEGHLKKSDYFYLVDFRGVTVAEVQGLRRKLAAQGAEYHVVKNNLLTVALRQLGRPDMRAHLEGHTALVVGGKEPFEVAKAVFNFSKDTKKAAVKVGVMGADVLPAEQVAHIAQLPSFPALRAQLLGTLLAAPQSLLYLMKARSEQPAAA